MEKYEPLFAYLREKYKNEKEEYGETKIIQKQLNDGSKPTFLMINTKMRDRGDEYKRYVMLNSNNLDVISSTDGSPLVTLTAETDYTVEEGFTVLPSATGGKKRKSKSIRRNKSNLRKKSNRRNATMH
jgi:hypothetical protein